MIAGNYSRYHINKDQFYNLFTENVNIKTLDALSESAASGNLDCIDMLYNLEPIPVGIVRVNSQAIFKGEEQW